MIRHEVFNKYAAEYDAWFEKYPFVFQTELAAIRKLWPQQQNIKSLEIGCATGRFAKELNILEGIDPSLALCSIAEQRGVVSICGIGENLPYQNNQFDVVLINFCISYFTRPQLALNESLRVLKPGGAVIVGFLKKESMIGAYYESRRAQDVFYKDATFFSVPEIEAMMNKAGYVNLEVWQTLFHPLEAVATVEECIPGSNIGSYIFIKAFRKSA